MLSGNRNCKTILGGGSWNPDFPLEIGPVLQVKPQSTPIPQALKASSVPQLGRRSSGHRQSAREGLSEGLAVLPLQSAGCEP